MRALQKFCFCAPLRPGLLVCRYIKLTCLPILFGLTIWGMVPDEFGYPAIGIEYLIASLIAILIDTLFTIIFIVSAHKKNYKYLKICYIYGIVTATLSTVGIIIGGGYMTIFVQALAGYPLGLYYLLFFLLILAIHIPVQVYIILLIKSELSKLKNNVEVKYRRDSDGDALYEKQENDANVENI